MASLRVPHGVLPWRDMVSIFLFCTAIKILLIPSYHSTDFDVHRNWLAITHNLPLDRWYYENTSQWTLDYPPFFAYFEWGLSQFAPIFDPAMLEVRKDPYASEATVLFQRLTVIATDAVLFLGVALYCTTWPQANTATEIRSSRPKILVVTLLVLVHPALLIVDHIHFQYNGFLLGLFLISVALLRLEQDVAGAAVFMSLIMFKHIFVYCAPVFTVYLFRHYCFVEVAPDPRPPKSTAATDLPNPGKVRRVFAPARLLALGATVLAVTAAGLLPILLSDPLGVVAGARQLLRRLFPFGRGLCHAYWAPNVWALYAGMDKALVLACRLLRRLGVSVPVTITSSMTGGLVQVQSFSVLPNIAPWVTFALTLVAMVPVLRSLWSRPDPKIFVSGLAYCCMCSFMLGYHVHEKAIIMIIVPLAMSACDSIGDAKVFFLVSVVGTFSLFPLLFQPKEAPLLPMLLLGYAIVAYECLCWFNTVHRRHNPLERPSPASPSPCEGAESCSILGNTSRLYLAGMVALYLFNSIVHPLLLSRLPFLPLMLMSVYCGLGSIAWWRMMFHQHLYNRQQCIEQVENTH